MAGVLAGWANAARACEGSRVVFDYPIVIKAPSAAAGSPVDSLTAFARRGGAWHEVPVQVEEINARGDYVLAGGLPYTKGTDDGLLDDNDEIVVDGLDLGDDFAFADVPERELSDARRLWKVRFCRGDRLIGHLLFKSRMLGGATTAKPKVRFDSRAGEVATDLYLYRFHRDSPALLGEVLLRQGGRKRPVIRDSRFLMPLRTPFWLPNLTFDDSDFDSLIESWQSGPHRTIVAVGVKYSTFLSLFELHLFSELVFYRNRFVIPSVIEFIFDPSSILRPGSGIAYALRFPPEAAWEVSGNLAPLPAMSAAEVKAQGQTAAMTEVFEVRGRSPHGAFRVDVRVDPKARASVPPPFLIRPAQFASTSHQAHWPWLKDLPGDLGVFLDFSGVRKGLYDFGLDLLLSSRADETFTDYGLVDTTWLLLPMRR